MPATVADRILAALDGLTPGETRVGRAVLGAYPGLGLRSATTIARAAHASPATVLRFVAKVGFASLPDFQDALRQEIDARLSSPFDLYHAPPDETALLAQVIEAETRNLRETLGRLDADALAAVAGTLAEASSVLVLGGRFSRGLAHYLHAHLQLLRGGVTLLGEAATPVPEHVAGAGRGTCLVVFDFRRYAPEAAFAARHVKRRRGRVVLITDPYLSPAAHDADHTLVASVEGSSLVDSYTAAMALLDVVVSELLARDESGAAARLQRIEEARAEAERRAEPE